MENTYTCYKCSIRLKYKRNLIRHEQTCDISTTKTKDILNKCCITCPECKQIFGRVENLRLHVAEAHDVPQEVEKIRFLATKDFEIWKKWIEKENLCYYHKRRSSSEKGIKKSYFYCHRTGFFKSGSIGPQQLKSRGTNKIDATCTSTMILTEYAGYVDVTFHKTHFGHDINSSSHHSKAEKRSRKTTEDVPIAENHKFSKEIESEKMAKTSETTWEISSSSRKNVAYEVTLINGSCIENVIVNHDIDNEDQKIQDIIHQLDNAKDILLTNEYTADELSIIEKEAENLMNLITKKRSKLV